MLLLFDILIMSINSWLLITSKLSNKEIQCSVTLELHWWTYFTWRQVALCSTEVGRSINIYLWLCSNKAASRLTKIMRELKYIIH